MNKNTICIEKLEKAYLKAPNLDSKRLDSRTMTLQANIMGIGYVMDETLSTAVSELPQTEFESFAKELVETLKKLKGDNVVHKPMYPNFPRQVMEASDLELFVNAIMHYWSFGTWQPFYAKDEREFAFESVKFRTIGLATLEDFYGIFTSILASNESISERDKKVVQWFLDNASKLPFPDVIPFKENMCIVGAYMVENGIPINNLVSNATDVLRIATHMSGGDISLAENTRFKSFKRSQRKNIVRALDKVARLEDLARHPGKWTKLAHSLHVGEYFSRVYALMKKIRENEKIETFNSVVEKHLSKNHPVKATKKLMERPGDFARRLDHVLRMTPSDKNKMLVINKFLEVADRVSTRVLLQLMGHFSNRHETQENRVVFPKGNIQRAELIDAHAPLSAKVVDAIYFGIMNVLENRFAQEENLGNIYIDSMLKKCPIPTQQRSASEGTFDLARGTRMPIAGDKNTLRFFIYWKGRDIDLSTVFYNENFNTVGSVSYTGLRDHNRGVYHSGDITNARNGASEFIDVDMEKARASGVRYVAMSVLVFSGPTFAEHDTCFAGWMTRSNPDSNEIYDPKTVEYKLDLNSDNKNSVPVIFDLETREAIWTDLTHMHKISRGWYGSINNVHTNKATLEDTVKAMISTDNKVSLFDLFFMHHKRGTLVTNREDADIVFAWDGDVKPSDVNTINSEYVVG